MKTIVNKIFVISGIIPATILLLLCFGVIGKFFTDSHNGLHSNLYLLSSVLGIVGYAGLIFLLIENKVKSWIVICFLTLGLCSFVIFTNMTGEQAWNWVLTVEEPDEWFIYVWPSIVSFVSIVRIIVRRVILKR